MNWTGYHILLNTNAHAFNSKDFAYIHDENTKGNLSCSMYPIHEKLLLKIIPARMKGIRRDILPNTKTGNQKVASAMKIQKCKMLR